MCFGILKLDMQYRIQPLKVRRTIESASLIQKISKMHPANRTVDIVVQLSAKATAKGAPSEINVSLPTRTHSLSNRPARVINPEKNSTSAKNATHITMNKKKKFTRNIQCKYMAIEWLGVTPSDKLLLPIDGVGMQPFSVTILRNQCMLLVFLFRMWWCLLLGRRVASIRNCRLSLLNDSSSSFSAIMSCCCECRRKGMRILWKRGMPSWLWRTVRRICCGCAWQKRKNEMWELYLSYQRTWRLTK